MPILPNAVLPNGQGGGSFSSQVQSAITSSVMGSVGLSQASTRQNVADMFKYSERQSASGGPLPTVIYPQAEKDWRVRVSLAPGSDYFQNEALLSPLTGGIGVGGGTNAIQGLVNKALAGTSRLCVTFPYTPQVAITHTANYTPVELAHNNYKHYAYNNSDVGAITISGEFTVQNVNDGQYLMASIYFFRACTKMFFGADPLAGNPPPIVYLNGYGQYYLPNVPCVVTSVQHTMPQDCDYMDIPEPKVTLAGYNPQTMNYRLNSTRMPTTSTLTVSLQPVYSRMAQSQGFSLQDFASGALVNSSGVNPGITAFGASVDTMYANKGSNAIKGPQNGGFL